MGVFKQGDPLADDMEETRQAVLGAIENGPVSGPAVAERLGISRAAVWKHVEALREDGFDIEGGRDGYRLAGVPEYGAAIQYGLEAPFSIEYHDRIASTNDRARELASDGAADVVVIADQQTGGRGRHARPWASPSGGVWMSLVLRPDLPPAHLPVLTLAAAVATAEAVRQTGVEAQLKWPNDVVVPTESSSEATPEGNGKKLAGILTELTGETDRVYWAVIGIGLNANVDAEDLPSTATSLREQVGDVDRRELVQSLLTRFHDLRSAPESVLPAWRELSHTLGRHVRVALPDQTIEGKAVDVVFPGHLVVETGGERRRIQTGECELLRPV